MKYFVKYNLVFRGIYEKLYENSNGNFLGLIEMLVEFDSVIKEYVYRIISGSIYYYYFGYI